MLSHSAPPVTLPKSEQEPNGRPASSLSLQPVTLPFQRSLPAPTFTAGELFPLAVRPSPSAAEPTLDETLAHISHLARSGWVREQLTQHGGAVLFRGLPVKNALDFSKVAYAFGFKEHQDIGLDVVRTILAPNVATANEGPPSHPVHAHNEYGRSAHFPNYLFFYCLKPAVRGGETPIHSSLELFHRLQTEIPQFVDELVQKGITYKLHYPAAENVSSNVGRAWREAWIPIEERNDEEDLQTQKERAEKSFRKIGARWEWQEDGAVLVYQDLPAIRRHTPTSLPTFFNNLVSFYAKAKFVGALDPPYQGSDGAYHFLVTYGDGTAIPREYFERVLQIEEEIRVLVEWEAGDVLLLDNHAVQHARIPWEGERRVLASLWDDQPIGVY